MQTLDSLHPWVLTLLGVGAGVLAVIILVAVAIRVHANRTRLGRATSGGGGGRGARCTESATNKVNKMGFNRLFSVIIGFVRRSW